MFGGITRDVALELLRGDGLSVEERDVSGDELRCATEVWVPRPTLELSSVVMRDDNPVGNGDVRPVRQQMNGLLLALKLSLMGA